MALAEAHVYITTHALYNFTLTSYTGKHIKGPK